MFNLFNTAANVKEYFHLQSQNSCISFPLRAEYHRASKTQISLTLKLKHMFSACPMIMSILLAIVLLTNPLHPELEEKTSLEQIRGGGQWEPRLHLKEARRGTKGASKETRTSVHQRGREEVWGAAGRFGPVECCGFEARLAQGCRRPQEGQVLRSSAEVAMATGGSSVGGGEGGGWSTRERERNRVGDYVGHYATAASAAEGLLCACARAHTHAVTSLTRWGKKSYMDWTWLLDAVVHPVGEPQHQTHVTGVATDSAQMLKKSSTFGMDSSVTFHHASVAHLIIWPINYPGEGHLETRQDADNQNEPRLHCVKRGDIFWSCSCFYYF